MKSDKNRGNVPQNEINQNILRGNCGVSALARQIEHDEHAADDVVVIKKAKLDELERLVRALRA